MAGPPNNHDRRRNSEFQISEFQNHTVDKSKSSFISKAEPRLLSNAEFCISRIESLQTQVVFQEHSLISSDSKSRDGRAYQVNAFDTYFKFQ